MLDYVVFLLLGFFLNKHHGNKKIKYIKFSISFQDLGERWNIFLFFYIFFVLIMLYSARVSCIFHPVCEEVLQEQQNKVF